MENRCGRRSQPQISWAAAIEAHAPTQPKNTPTAGTWHAVYQLAQLNLQTKCVQFSNFFTLYMAPTDICGSFPDPCASIAFSHSQIVLCFLVFLLLLLVLLLHLFCLRLGLASLWQLIHDPPSDQPSTNRVSVAACCISTTTFVLVGVRAWLVACIVGQLVPGRRLGKRKVVSCKHARAGVRAHTHASHL